MRLRTLCLALGFAALAPAAPALAGDWNRGSSVKDYGSGGVQVPAPIPYAETFKWYLRADIGGGVTSNPDVTEQGMQYGLNRDPTDGTSFGMSPTWFNSSFDTFAMGGVGVGAYLTPRIRADLTVDSRTKSSIEANGSYSVCSEYRDLWRGSPGRRQGARSYRRS